MSAAVASRFETCSNISCAKYQTEFEVGIVDECPLCHYPLLLKTRSKESSNEDRFMELIGRADRA